jgi:transposase
MEDVKRPVGKPTDYKPEYCQELIDYMAQGYGYLAFAGKIGVSIQTMYDWEKAHDEYLEAKERAFEANRRVWDEAATDAALGRKTGINPTIMIFNLKNRFPKEWRDRRELDLAGSLSATSDDLKKLSPEELRAIQEIHERANARKDSDISGNK